MRDDKIAFANQLRGLAVLSVIFGHYTWIYWADRSLVATYIRAPVVTGPASRISSYANIPTFNFGPFGVALFFLISGFVIPFSIEKLGRGKFAIARILRIVPTYWIACAITLTVAEISGTYWGRPSVFTPQEVLQNLFLINPQVRQPSLDLVNWTLAIEVLFYICAACMWPFIRRGSSLALVNFAVVVLAYLKWAPAAWNAFKVFDIQVSMGPTRYEMMLVCFIFIGTLFNFRLREKISSGDLIGSTSAIFVVFLMMWQDTELVSEFWSTPLNYGYALAVFSACFALRARFRASRILDFIADISYPLYLIHAVMGYAVARFLTSLDAPFPIAISIALTIVVGAAYVIHIAVEAPTARLGKVASKKNPTIATMSPSPTDQ